MKCKLCANGETKPGTVTVTLHREGTTILIKGVPGEVCQNCGEYYLTPEMQDYVLARAQTASAKGAVEIVCFPS